MKRLITLLIVFCAVGGAQSERARISFFQKENLYYKAIQKEYYRMLKHYHINYQFRGWAWRFFAFDLCDTTNYLSHKSDTLIIFDNHIYYIVTPSLYERVSIVMVPPKESLYFFLGINCCKPIHRVSDVLEWLSEQHIAVDEGVAERVGDFLSYYQSVPVDPQGKIPRCECSGNYPYPLVRGRYKKPRKINL